MMQQEYARMQHGVECGLGLNSASQLTIGKKTSECLREKRAAETELKALQGQRNNDRQELNKE